MANVEVFDNGFIDLAASIKESMKTLNHDDIIAECDRILAKTKWNHNRFQSFLWPPNGSNWIKRSKKWMASTTFQFISIFILWSHQIGIVFQVVKRLYAIVDLKQL